MMLNSLRPAVNGKYTWKSHPTTKTFEDASPNQGPEGKTKYWTLLLGRYNNSREGDATKTDEFSEKFKQPLAPSPLNFGKSYYNFFPP